MFGALGLPDIAGELSEMLLSLQDPPPGSDEIVALSKVADYLDKGVEVEGRVVKFDRVVLDTAPTGHTLRMLQLPEFLLKLIAKLRALRSKGGAAGGVMGMLNVSPTAPEESGAADLAQPVSPDKLTALEWRMRRLQQILHSPEECEFTIVTIPTELATAESVRLLDALQQENILVRRLIINQVIPTSLSAPSMNGGVNGESTAEGAAVSAAADRYLGNLRAGQARALQDLRGLSETKGVKLVEVPYYDTEVRTVYGLRLISDLLSSVMSE
jgi:arsenite-transporting ATPase